MTLIVARRAVLRTLTQAMLCLGVGMMAGCEKADPQGGADGPFLATNMGYIRAPEILKVTIGGNGVVKISGVARPDGRVRLTSRQGQAFGVTANTRGEFEAELPNDVNGNLYDLSMEDSGRLMKAEGRLFVPTGQPERAVFMRSGYPSLPLSPHAPLLAVVDYDGLGGVAVAGRTKAGAVVALGVNGADVARVKADEAGLYSAILPLRQSLVGQAVMLTAQSEGAVDARTVELQAEPGEMDSIQPTEAAWKVHWLLPGGGSQTTMVY
jgi:hypothetical protein